MPQSSCPSLAKRPHLETGNEAHPGGKNCAGGSVSTSSADTRRKGVWGSALLMCCSHQPHHLHVQIFRLVCFSIFFINREVLHLTGLCLIWFRVTIFSLGPILPCSLTSSSSVSRQLQLIIPLFRRRWMSCSLREQWNHLACLWFLGILVASGPYLTSSILIIICIYLLSRCQLSDMFGSLSS